MPMLVSVDVTSAVEKALRYRELLSQMRDFTAPLKTAGVWMIKSVDKNFKEGGRPSSWVRSGASDMRSGWVKRKGGQEFVRGQTLMKTGALRNSIVGGPGGIYQLSENRLVIGTNIKYASVHQFGFDGEVTQAVGYHTRTITKAWGRELKTPKTISVASHARLVHMRIPARPFLLFQDEDRIQIANIFRRWYARMLRAMAPVEAEGEA